MYASHCMHNGRLQKETIRTLAACTFPIHEDHIRDFDSIIVRHPERREDITVVLRHMTYNSSVSIS